MTSSESGWTWREHEHQPGDHQQSNGADVCLLFGYHPRVWVRGIVLLDPWSWLEFGRKRFRTGQMGSEMKLRFKETVENFDTYGYGMTTAAYMRVLDNIAVAVRAAPCGHRYAVPQRWIGDSQIHCKHLTT